MVPILLRPDCVNGHAFETISYSRLDDPSTSQGEKCLRKQSTGYSVQSAATTRKESHQVSGKWSRIGATTVAIAITHESMN